MLQREPVKLQGNANLHFSVAYIFVPVLFGFSKLLQDEEMRLREVEEEEKKQMMKERQQKLLEGQLVRQQA